MEKDCKTKFLKPKSKHEKSGVMNDKLDLLKQTRLAHGELFKQCEDFQKIIQNK